MNDSNLSLTMFCLIGQGGKMAVATFFFIGGFLTCFLSLKQVWKNNWTILRNIIYRALRILPTYLFIILFYYSCITHLTNGPNFSASKGAIHNC